MNLRRLPAALPAVAVFLTLAAPASAGSAACQHADARPGQASKSALARSAVCLLNKQRAQRGMRKLRLNGRLSQAARSHTQDMVRRNYFSHTSMSGNSMLQRLTRTGYMRGARSWLVGENLAWGSGQNSTPGEILKSWMASPGHRHNILQRRFREIGIGVAFEAPFGSSSAAATYTTTFGARS